MDTFIALRNYAKGKITDRELEGSDKMIYTIEHESGGPGNCRVVIGDERKDILSDLDLLSDDDVWFYSVINNSYSDYQFNDYDSTREGFLDGYGFYGWLDESNIEKLEKISKYIHPKKINFKGRNYNDFSDFSHSLENQFRDETNSMIESYAIYNNEAMTRAMRAEMEHDFSKFFKDNGEFTYEDGYSYNKITITVNNLIVLYVTTGLLQYNIRQLLNHYFENKKNSFGGWYEDAYGIDPSEYFNGDSFNRDIDWQLDKIIDLLEDENSGEFSEMVNRIIGDFDLGEWYVLPKDKDVKFRVDGFVNEKPFKIRVGLRKDFKFKTLRLSEENFNNLLYQPTLFDMSEIY